MTRIGALIARLAFVAGLIVVGVLDLSFQDWGWAAFSFALALIFLEMSRRETRAERRAVDAAVEETVCVVVRPAASRCNR